MLRLLMVILFLMIGVDFYLLFIRRNTDVSAIGNPSLTDATALKGWPIYDGGNWSIQHPSSLTPTSKNSGNLVSFGGFGDGSTLTVHTSNILNDPLGEIVLKRDPRRLDVLKTIIALQKEALQGFSKQKLIAARKVTINKLDAAQIIEVDFSNPSDITYSAQTTFAQADSLAFVELFTNRSPEPTARTEQIYNAMLKSFQFK